MNKDGCVFPVDITQLAVTQTHIHQNQLTQTRDHSSALDKWQGPDENMVCASLCNLEGENQSVESMFKTSLANIKSAYTSLSAGG